MMKFQSLFLTLLALASPMTTSAQWLRSDSVHPDVVRQLNANTDLINSVIALLIPPTNTLLQSLIPDTVNISSLATTLETEQNTTTLNQTDPPNFCSDTSIQSNLSLGEITGLNTTFIDSLTVQEGTESVTVCCPTRFSGSFELVLAAEFYAIDGQVNMSTLPNKCIDETSEITVTVNKPTFTGELFLAGAICQDTAELDNVTLLTLEAACENITTAYDPPLPESVADAQQAVNDYISDSVKPFISATVTPLMNFAIEQALEQQDATCPPSVTPTLPTPGCCEVVWNALRNFGNRLAVTAQGFF